MIVPCVGKVSVYCGGWRFLDLRWRWRRWIGFNFDLRVGVVWHVICYLWHWWRVCYLWSWRRLRVVGCCIVVWLVVCRRLGLVVMIGLRRKMRRVGWGILLVVGSPLHGVIDFSWCGLMWRLCGILLYFLFWIQKGGAIFGVAVGCAVVIHVVRRFECVRSSAMAWATIRCSASFATLCGSLVESSLMSFLRRCFRNFLLIF
jgi:hypothetical protein